MYVLCELVIGFLDHNFDIIIELASSSSSSAAPPSSLLFLRRLSDPSFFSGKNCITTSLSLDVEECEGLEVVGGAFFDEGEVDPEVTGKVVSASAL